MFWSYKGYMPPLRGMLPVPLGSKTLKDVAVWPPLILRGIILSRNPGLLAKSLEGVQIWSHLRYYSGIFI
ncbi:hypothetical protein GCM10027051_35870 [Niabella terrae]